MPIEIANAFVSLTVSARGISAEIQRELGAPVEAAAAKATAGVKNSLKDTAATFTKTGLAATGAAALIGGGLVHMADNFEQTALQAGKFATATGLSVDAASRFIEISKDLGTDTEIVQAAIGRMNRAANDTPDAFAGIDASIVRTKSGAVDVQGTFLSVITALNAIQDPAKRQAAAMQILGRGWQGMSQLIGAGATDLEARLKSVGQAQVVSPAELAKAKQYRDALDTMRDAGEGLAIDIGSNLVPMLSNLARGAGTVFTAFDKLNSITGGAAGDLAGVGAAGVGVVGGFLLTVGVTLKLRDSLSKLKSQLTSTEGGLTGLGKATAGIAVASALAAGEMYAQARAAEQAAHRQDEFTASIDRLKSVSDAAFGRAFGQTLGEGLAQMALDGKKAADVFDGIAQADIVGARRALDWAQANGVKQNVIDGLSAAIARQEAATQQAATTEATYGGAVATATDIAAAAKDMQDANTRSIQATIDARKAETDGLRAELDARLASIDTGFALADAQDAQRKHLRDLPKLLADAKKNGDDLNSVYRDGAKLAVASAAADEANALQLAAANGTTLNAVQLQERRNKDLLFSAGVAGPQERAEILRIIATQNGIPESKMTEIRTDLNQGHFDAALAKINELSATREMAVKVTAAVNVVFSDFAKGINLPRHAAGVAAAQPGLALVGERGTELVDFRGGERVFNASDTRQLLDGALSQSAGSDPTRGGLTIINNRRDIGLADLNHVLAMARLAA